MTSTRAPRCQPSCAIAGDVPVACPSTRGRVSTSATTGSERRSRDSRTRRHGVRSAYDSERPTTVTHGQSWSLGGDTRESDQSAFALVRTLRTSPKLVVRGRGELPTFRFSGRRDPASQPVAELSVADVHASHCSIVSAGLAVSGPRRCGTSRAAPTCWTLAPASGTMSACSLMMSVCSTRLGSISHCVRKSHRHAKPSKASCCGTKLYLARSLLLHL